MMDYSRCKFESWAKDKMQCHDISRRGFGYMSPFIDALWMSWVASQESCNSYQTKLLRRPARCNSMNHQTAEARK